jgi:15-cis-phytoene synthase
MSDAAKADHASQTPTAAEAGSLADVVRVAARAFEVDRYLAALLAPKAAREDLIALAAFAGEIARIPLYVTEPMMGRIRLQWWREALEAGADGGHPIASAIISAISRHSLNAAEFVRLIDAHEMLLEDAPFADDPALRAHFAATDGVLLACAYKVLGPGFGFREGPSAEDQIAAVSAYGLARMLADMPVTLAAGRVLVPRDRLAANHLTPDAVARAAASDTPQWQALIADLRREARRLHQRSAATFGALPRSHRAALYHLALVEPYLNASEGRRNEAGAILPVQPLTRVWRLFLARWTGWLGTRTPGGQLAERNNV